MNSGAGDPVWRSGWPTSRIAVIVALELEAAILRRALGTACPPVQVCGPGLERARAAGLEAVARGAGALIGWGLAGGLSHEADSGTVLLPEQLMSAAGSWRTDAEWRTRVAAALGPDLLPLHGPLYSAHSVLTDPADKAALAAATGAVAVDMESAAIARVAFDAGLPCLILRVVADGPFDALPAGVEKLVTDRGRTRLRGLLPFVLMPARLAALIRLGHQSKIARSRLRQLASRLMERAA
jgi:adenosylhomocysteine nucleosidase